MTATIALILVVACFAFHVGLAVGVLCVAASKGEADRETRVYSNREEENA